RCRGNDGKTPDQTGAGSGRPRLVCRDHLAGRRLMDGWYSRSRQTGARGLPRHRSRVSVSGRTFSAAFAAYAFEGGVSQSAAPTTSYTIGESPNRVRGLPFTSPAYSTPRATADNRSFTAVAEIGFVKCVSNPASRARRRSSDCPHPVSAAR